MDFSDEDWEEFRNEALELLNEAEVALIEVDQGLSFESRYNAIFRAFHSVKGASGMLGLNDLNQHLHKIEDHFSQLKSKNELSSFHCSYFLEAIDKARLGINKEPIHFSYDFDPLNQVIAIVPSAESPADVIVVDDEIDLVEIIGNYLFKEKLNFKGFTDPTKALSEIKERPPKIVLTDFNMPHMNGISLIKEIRKSQKDLPIIMISAFLDKETLLKGFESGVTGFIEKPTKESYLIAQIKQSMLQAETKKLLEKTFKIILFQLPEIDSYMTEKGKIENLNLLKTDIKNLLEMKRQLSKT